MTNKPQKSHNEDMDQNPSKEEPTVYYFGSTPIYKQKWFVIGILLALSPFLVIVVTWFQNLPLFKGTTETPPAATSSASLKEENLPIALNILQNPLVYEWRGSVSGTLVAKDNESITISNDKGQTIKISVDLNPNYTGTKFYKNKPSEDPRSNFVSLDDIPIGTRLAGDFFVFPHQKNQLVGSSFIVSE